MYLLKTNNILAIKSLILNKNMFKKIIKPAIATVIVCLLLVKSVPFGLLAKNAFADANSNCLCSSDCEGQLIRAINHIEIYKVISGKKVWVPSVEAFSKAGYKWYNVNVVCETVINKYPTARLLKLAGDPKVYYLADNNMKRHIPSIKVFDSYKFCWNNVVEVPKAVLDGYRDNVLIRLEGDYKIYKLENDNKRWIETAEAFNRLRYNWADVSFVNKTEFDFYPTCPSIK